jgi:hypothetical protein
MFGWVVFFLGIVDLVLGVYGQIGIWICVPIAVSWYIILLKAGARAKKARLEGKILAERIKETFSSDVLQC